MSNLAYAARTAVPLGFIDAHGEAQEASVVEIRGPLPSSSLATLYSDADKTPLANPTATSATGELEVFTDQPGDYTVILTVTRHGAPVSFTRIVGLYPDPRDIGAIPFTTGVADYLSLPDPTLHRGEVVITDDGGTYQSNGLTGGWVYIPNGRPEVDIRNLGGRGNDPDEDTLALAKAYDWLPNKGGKLTISAVGTNGWPGYQLLPDSQTGRVISLDGTKKFRVEGVGPADKCRLQIVAGAGDFVGVWVAETANTDCSGIEHAGYSIDLNAAGNPIVLTGGEDPAHPYEWHLQQKPPAGGDWANYRAGIIASAGGGMLVEDMVFYDPMRQCVRWNSPGMTEVHHSTIRRCRKVVTVDQPHDAVHDWDLTDFLIRGYGNTVEDIWLEGFQPALGDVYAYAGARVGVQNTGSRSTTRRIYGWRQYRLVVVGNIGCPGRAEMIIVEDVYGWDCAEAVEFSSLTWNGWDGSDGGFGVDDLLMRNIHMHSNKTRYARDFALVNGTAPVSHDFGTPTLVRWYHQSAAPVRKVTLEEFSFVNAAAYKEGGSHGVDMSPQPPDDPDDPSDGVILGRSEQINVRNGLVVRPGLNGVTVRPKYALSVHVDNVDVVDSGHRTGAGTISTAAVRLGGDIRNWSVKDCPATDTNPITRKMSAAFYDGVTPRQTIRITGGPTGGTFTATFGGQTATVPLGATGAALQVLLQALSTIGANNVMVEGPDAGTLDTTPSLVVDSGLLGPSFTPRGAWVSATSYVENDVVSSAGLVYLNILATNGTTAPVGDPTHWQLLAGPYSVRFAGTLDNNTTLLSVSGAGLTGGAPKVTVGFLDVGLYRPGQRTVADGSDMPRITLATGTLRPQIESSATGGVAVTADKRLTLGDLGTRQEVTSAVDVHITIPAFAEMPARSGDWVEIQQLGVGHVIVDVDTPAGMPAIVKPNGNKTSTVGSIMRAQRQSTVDQYSVNGDTIL